MQFSQISSALALVASASALSFAPYTDSNGIDFYRASFDTLTDSVGQFGYALPAAAQTEYSDEYIGNIVFPRVDGDETWFGVVHTSGMTNGLILLAWVDGEDVHTSFRFATGYTAPDIYTGNATLIPISQTLNKTHVELSFRCQSCWVIDQDGVEVDKTPATTKAAAQIMGWAQATTAPTTPGDDDSAIA